MSKGPFNYAVAPCDAGHVHVDIIQDGKVVVAAVCTGAQAMKLSLGLYAAAEAVGAVREDALDAHPPANGVH
jgi:hypothetical protein